MIIIKSRKYLVSVEGKHLETVYVPHFTRISCDILHVDEF